MKIPKELEKARLNITRTAEFFSMDPGHLRRLHRRGVVPAPKRTAKGMPYYDHDLLIKIAEVLRSGVGLNNEEISFYRRKEKPPRSRRKGTKGNNPQSTDAMVQAVIEGCTQLGVPKDKLDPETIRNLVGDCQGELKDVIPAVARRLLKDHE